MAGGVDEGDGAFLTVDLCLNLVGADCLRDATGLACHHVGVAQCVEQFRLAVVDVTHDGDDRRTGPEVLLAADVLPELQVEGFEQFAVLVLRRDHLDVVVQLGAQHLKSVVGDRLGGGDHLTQVEQHLNQGGRLYTDLLGEVRQGSATAQPHGLAVALAEPHTTDGGGLHLVELLPALLLGLTSTPAAGTAATEGTLGATAATATATTARTTGRAAHRRATESTTAGTSL